MDVEDYEHLGKPTLFTKGRIGSYYPTNNVNRLLTFKDEMNTIKVEDKAPQNET
jgi:hypothetical protein